MTFQLPELPFAKDALAPYLSAETIEYHYGRHHKNYVETLNTLIAGNALEKETSLESIVRKTGRGPIFNNAAQAWNHAFYWNCLAPARKLQPSLPVSDMLTDSFGSIDSFKEQFSTSCMSLFGSGWVWLALKEDRLSIEQTANAGTPIASGMTPLLVCDVWEHAYYIDYRNARMTYVEAFWNIVNWEFVARNVEQAAVAV